MAVMKNKFRITIILIFGLVLTFFIFYMHSEQTYTEGVSQFYIKENHDVVIVGEEYFYIFQTNDQRLDTHNLNYTQEVQTLFKDLSIRKDYTTISGNYELILDILYVPQKDVEFLKNHGFEVIGLTTPMMTAH